MSTLRKLRKNLRNLESKSDDTEEHKIINHVTQYQQKAKLKSYVDLRNQRIKQKRGYHLGKNYDYPKRDKRQFS